MTSAIRLALRLMLTGAILVAVLGSALPVSAAGSTIRMDPATYVGAASGTFVIDVIADTQGQQMRAYEFGLTYDASKIDVLSVVEGPFMKDWALANGGSTTSATGGWNAVGNSGTVAPAGYAVAGAGTGGVVGEGVVAVITVQALAPTSGGTLLAFSAGAFLADQEINPMTPLSEIESRLWLGEQPPMPDLIVQSLDLDVDPGDAAKYRVQATVKNQGGSSADPSFLEIRIDGSVFETLAIGSLDAGDTESVSTVAQATLTPENDTIDACADSADELSESNEDNNCDSMTYSLLSESDQVDTHVNAELKKYISLRAPADIPHTDWQLKIGANTKSDIGASGLGVKSNGNWTVTAADLDTATAGKMKEFDGSSFLTQQLFDPLHVVAESDVTLAGPAIVQTGGPNTSEDWQDFDVTFSQNVRFRDVALDTTWYHIVVTFSGSTGF